MKKNLSIIIILFLISFNIFAQKRPCYEFKMKMMGNTSNVTEYDISIGSDDSFKIQTDNLMKFLFKKIPLVVNQFGPILKKNYGITRYQNQTNPISKEIVYDRFTNLHIYMVKDKVVRIVISIFNSGEYNKYQKIMLYNVEQLIYDI